jgi:hypothetical protein
MVHRIGILHGRERSFPEAFVAEVNRRNAGFVAEPLRIDAGRHDMEKEYAVIVDRISHEVPFYRSYLKQAALLGTVVINNPFWQLADDKYFGTCLAARLGIAVPKSVVLPQREYVEDISAESLTNMIFLNWEAVGAYTGYPCFLKPAHGGGWKSVSKCGNLEELLYHYNQSGRQVMMLQEGIAWQAYARLICIGKENIRIAPWDPTLPHHERYAKAAFTYTKALEARMLEQAEKLNTALGYDMNTVEFAIRDGVPYAIDFMNTAPDFDRSSLPEETFQWVVHAMADLAIEEARSRKGTEAPLPRWDRLL